MNSSRKQRILLLCVKFFTFSLALFVIGVITLHQAVGVGWIDVKFILLIALATIVSWTLVLTSVNKKLIKTISSKQTPDNKSASKSPVYHAPTFENYQQLNHLLARHKRKYHGASFSASSRDTEKTKLDKTKPLA